ncbi:putative peptidyl-prolyl cis-trans isomerase/foldase, PrsA [Sulfurovum sp. enrichment culture clone C5]|uniref:Putative peptidyl-prolyl cis-trans isomerase/foldase, PrsA n=1 Tax=Sulfurovum sp. enrichment culture clone C5 TaxID=497650 RepID=A0A0S4XQ64_9BACT|nr:putative peptidyl-prolyl cis-trans isomerase/foldase, PrsA [Sulfurovum sp. enrichment culture clone C5]
MNLFTKLFLLILFSISVNADVVLARVNGVVITENNAKDFLKTTNVSLDYSKLSKEQKIDILQKMVQKELFLQAAKKEKIENSPEFLKELEMLKKELMLNMWVKKQMNYMIVSDGEAKAFYKQNLKSFIEPTKIRASHILVKSETDAKNIISALKHLKGKILKDTFVLIAKDRSIDTQNRSNGGDLGEFSKNEMSADFSNAAWNLKAGTISLKPIQTPQGYHIIYVEERISPKAVSYEKVKPQIVALIKQQQLKKYLSQLSGELGKKAKIEVIPRNIK